METTQTSKISERKAALRLTSNTVQEAFSYFPILFVFSNSQVDRTVRNFNSEAVKAGTLPETNSTVSEPVTGDDLPF